MEIIVIIVLLPIAICIVGGFAFIVCAGAMAVVIGAWAFIIDIIIRIHCLITGAPYEDAYKPCEDEYELLD